MDTIRPCRPEECPAMGAIINAAAEAYRGAIPADCFHDPYMPPAELASEIAAGVQFWGCERDGVLVGVMGVQRVADVTLIRHAYVVPTLQRAGVGGRLLAHLRAVAPGRMLVGTWADATWAIRFYERHGFVRTTPRQAAELLGRYWTIPPRQAEVSVVLAHPPLS